MITFWNTTMARAVNKKEDLQFISTFLLVPILYFIKIVLNFRSWLILNNDWFKILFGTFMGSDKLFHNFLIFWAQIPIINQLGLIAIHNWLSIFIENNFFINRYYDREHYIWLKHCMIFWNFFRKLGELRENVTIALLNISVEYENTKDLLFEILPVFWPIISLWFEKLLVFFELFVSEYLLENIVRLCLSIIRI